MDDSIIKGFYCLIDDIVRKKTIIVMAGCAVGEGNFMSKYTFGKVPLTTVMLEHLIENQNVEGKVVGVFAGDVHPESDNSSDRLKSIWNTDPSSKPGQHWILCILCKKSFKK